MRKHLIFIIILFNLFLPQTIFGALFYFETNKEFYYRGETVVANLYLDSSSTEPINAVEVYLDYPKEILKPINVNMGNSLLLVINQPTIDEKKGLISFSGIIPGGFIGTLRGDPGKSNLLASLYFEAISDGFGEIRILPQSKALLNDAQATAAEIFVQNLRVTIEKNNESFKLAENEWENLIKNDTIPPQINLLKIVNFNGDYYLLIYAQDKEAGIKNYYTKPVGIFTGAIRILNPNFANWQKIKIPHKLTFLYYQFKSLVKVEDHAGNVAIASVFLPSPFLWRLVLKCSIIIVLIIIGIIWFVKWLSLKRKKI